MKTIRFFQLDPPKITTTFDGNQNLMEGSNDSIVCHAIGTPRINVYWKLDETIFPSNKLEYDSTIKRMEKDVGDEQLNFTCVAENKFGNDSQTVSIKFVGEMERRKKYWKFLINCNLLCFC